jgi:MFS family permease
MAGTVGRARAALHSPDFRALLAGRLVNQLGDGFFQAYLVAQLVFLDPDAQGTALGIAAAYAIVVLPFSLLGPFAGVLIDRWSRRAILIWTPLVRAAAIALLLVAGGDGWPVLPVALVVTSLNRFFLSSAGAVPPLLVPDRDLLVANSMSAVGGTVISFVGIVAGTKLADPIGTRGLLIVVLCLWPVAGLVMTRIRHSLRTSAQREPAGHGIAEDVRVVARGLAAGLRRLRATPPALGAIVSASLDQFLVGFVTVLSVVVFKDRFQEGVGSYGNIIAAGGVGVLVGSLTVGWLEPRLARARIVALAFALAGAACMAAAPILTGPVIMVASFALGLTFSWLKVPCDTLVQETIPDRYRGRTFALYDILYASSRVVAAALAVPLIPHVSTGWMLAATGLAFLAWSPVLPRWVARRPRVGVRFYAGGRADEVPRAVVIGGEEEGVEVLDSRLEQRDGRRLRRFRLRTTFGDVVEISGDEGGDAWRLERDLPAEILGSGASSSDRPEPGGRPVAEDHDPPKP